MEQTILTDLLAHPSKPAILKPTPGALRRVVGTPNLRLLPLLCNHAALAVKVIPKLPMIVAPSVGAPFVTSFSLETPQIWVMVSWDLHHTHRVIVL